MKPKKYKNAKGETRWQFQIFIGRDPVTNKQINRKRTGFKSQQEALIAYAQLLEKREADALIDKSKVTVQQLFDSWWPLYERGIEKSTASKVDSYFKLHILPPVSSMLVSNLSSRQIQQLLDNWALEAKSGLVWGRYFKKLITYAFINEIIDVNPFDRVTTPKIVNKAKERKHDVFLNSEQLGRFLKYWENKPLKMYAYFRLMSYTGMRRGEMLALEWSDIDFEKRTVNISKAIGVNYLNNTTSMYLKEPKASSRRKISIDSKTVDIMKELYELSTKTIIWPGVHKYMDFNVPERWIQSFRNNKTVDDDLKNVTLHGLRHTHATVLFEQASRLGKAAPLKSVQKRLGHSTIEMTLNIYTHVTESENSIVSDILEGGLS
ncbi:MAG: site-specific integrase [Leuconostoc suionicum]|uniref:site-specific integrase n=1 Tax=Leuconostoc suionicum TaxID=1511761 RepID=UPI0039ED6CD0